jgi:Tol biopolymer transport system component
MHFWRFATKGGVIWSPELDGLPSPPMGSSGRLPWTATTDAASPRPPTVRTTLSQFGRRTEGESRSCAKTSSERDSSSSSRQAASHGSSHPGERISAGRASWDRNSRSLVYPLTVYRGDSIDVIDLGNQSIRRLTRSPWNDSEPSWSPDGRSIALTRDLIAPGGKEIFRMRANGTHVKRLTHHTMEDSSPSWSPSGKRIVFFRDTNQSWVATMDAKDGHHLKRVFRGRTSAWSPDGKTIAVGGNDRLFLVTPAGKVVRELAVGLGTGWRGRPGS